MDNKGHVQPLPQEAGRAAPGRREGGGYLPPRPAPRPVYLAPRLAPQPGPPVAEAGQVLWLVVRKDNYFRPLTSLIGWRIVALRLKML